MSNDILVKIGADVAGFSRDMKKVTDDLQNIGKNTEKSNITVGKLAKSLGLVAVGAKAFQVLSNSVGDAVSRFDTLNQFPKVLEALGVSAEDAERSVDTLSDGIDGLPTKLDDIATTAQRMYTSFGDMDKATESALALNNALLGSGSSSEQASRGTEMYLKMLQTGQVDLQTWRSLSETMDVGLIKIAESFGYAGKSAKDDLYKALQDGSITIEEFNDKLIEVGTGTGVMADLARENSLGLATSLTNLGTAVSRNLANIIEAFDNLSKEVTGKSIAEHIDGLKVVINNAFNIVRQAIELTTPLFKVFAATVKFLYEAFKPLTPVIVGATTALLGLLAVQKLQAMFTGASAGARLLTTATSLLTGKLTLATVATKAFATAKKLLGGPVGLAVAGIGALVGGVVGLVKWFRRETDEAKKLNAETEKLASETESLTDATESSAEAYESKQSSTEAEIRNNEDLAKKVQELADKESLSASEKETLRTYTDQLNESMDGLNLAYDEESGKLNQSSEQIQARIDLLGEQDKANDAMERAKEITEQQVEAEKKLGEVAELRQEWNDKLEDGSVKSREHKKAVEELDEQEKELEGTLKDLDAQYVATEEQVEASMDAIAEASKIATENQLLDYASLEDQQRELVDEMQSNWQDLAQASTNIFEKISTDAEVSFAEMQEIFDHNVKATADWADNLEELADAGVSSAFLDTFRDKGPESAALVQELVDADIKEVIKLGEGFEEQTEKALDQMAQVYNLDTKQFDAVKHLVKETGLTFEEAVKAAGFDQYGEDIVDGVVDGVDSSSDEAIDVLTQMSGAMGEAFRSANKIQSPSRLYKEYGQELPAGLKLGIEGKQNVAINAIKAVAKKMKEGLSGLSGDFRSVGVNAMGGLSAGIEGQRSSLMGKASSIASGIAGTLRSALQVRSPSRVMMEIGRWIPEGLAEGIAGNTRSVTNAVNAMTSDITTQDMSLSYDTPGGLKSSLAGAVSGTVDVNANDSMTARAIAGLSERLNGMQVVMEGEQVGVLVAPTVSREIQAETDGEIRRQGGRSIW